VAQFCHAGRTSSLSKSKGKFVGLALTPIIYVARTNTIILGFVILTYILCLIRTQVASFLYQSDPQRKAPWGTWPFPNPFGGLDEETALLHGQDTVQKHNKGKLYPRKASKGIVGGSFTLAVNSINGKNKQDLPSSVFEPICTGFNGLCLTQRLFMA